MRPPVATSARSAQREIPIKTLPTANRQHIYRTRITESRFALCSTIFDVRGKRSTAVQTQVSRRSLAAPTLRNCFARAARAFRFPRQVIAPSRSPMIGLSYLGTGSARDDEASGQQHYAAFGMHCGRERASMHRVRAIPRVTERVGGDFAASISFINACETTVLTLLLGCVCFALSTALHVCACCWRAVCLTRGCLGGCGDASGVPLLEKIERLEHGRLLNLIKLTTRDYVRRMEIGRGRYSSTSTSPVVQA